MYNEIFKNEEVKIKERTNSFVIGSFYRHKSSMTKS